MKFYCLLFLILLATACTSEKDNYVKASLTSFFDPFNWEVTNNSDTFYIFLNPLHDSLVEAYEYNIVNGDSVNTQKNSISFLNDSLIWRLKGNDYIIEKVDSNLVFLYLNNKTFHLNKISDSLMVLNGVKDSFRFRRTLPISTFLIRKKYDYLHGTSGSDSAEVVPRKLKKQNTL